MLVTDSSTLIRMDLADVRPMGRTTQGVALMRPDEGALVVAVSLIADADTVELPGDELPDVDA